MEIFFAAAIPTVVIVTVILKTWKRLDARLNAMEARLLSIKTDLRRSDEKAKSTTPAA